MITADITRAFLLELRGNRWQSAEQWGGRKSNVNFELRPPPLSFGRDHSQPLTIITVISLSRAASAQSLSGISNN